MFLLVEAIFKFFLSIVFLGLYLDEEKLIIAQDFIE